MDPKTLYELERQVKVFSTLYPLVHPLAKSTLFNSCSALHLVNSKDLLEEGSFQAEESFIKAGTTRFPIIGKGTKVIRKLLNRNSKEKTKTLTLKDIVIVKGFHTNIMSEALLHKKGI